MDGPRWALLAAVIAGLAARLAVLLTSLGLGLLAALGGRALSRRLFRGRPPKPPHRPPP
jgi:hypothetical protein